MPHAYTDKARTQLNAVEMTCEPCIKLQCSDIVTIGDNERHNKRQRSVAEVANINIRDSR